MTERVMNRKSDSRAVRSPRAPPGRLFSIPLSLIAGICGIFLDGQPDRYSCSRNNAPVIRAQTSLVKCKFLVP
jgi:hypothetical protein